MENCAVSGELKTKQKQRGTHMWKKWESKILKIKLKKYGFEHDIELVLLLKSKNIEIKELPVKWKHKDNSKVNVFLDPIKMFIGILIIRFRYL